MYSITASNPASAWKAALAYIELYGENVTTEDRSLTRELRNLAIEIASPLSGFPVAGSGWSIAALDVYAKQFFNPDKSGFDYTYGERIHQNNQYTKAVQRLRDNPSTRRAVIKTWQPCHDYINKHVPCLQLIELLIRDNKLHMTAIFRSQDFARAYVSNVYGLGRLLETAASEIGIKTGTLNTYSISAHIYLE